MRSPALAIAWELRQGHRVGLIALFGYLLVAGIVRFVVLGPGHLFRLDPPNILASMVIVPCGVTFMYFLAVFSFGLDGDLAGRKSIYPPRMFTLPVTTRALAGWPMLYGTASAACLWLTTALFVTWSSEIETPWIWPALLAAVFLAWTQVLTWMPYGLPGIRLIATVLWLVTLAAFVLVALHHDIRESVLSAVLAPQLPLAYLAACYAVAQARRGRVPDWRGGSARPGRIGDVTRHGRNPFSSPDRAQVWFEWRRHGRTLPVWVGVLLPFELALLFLARHEPPALIFYTLLAVLLTPPFMASFVAAAVSESNPQRRDSHGVTPFLATRPSTSAALVAAKLKMAAWSTAATWGLVLVAIPLVLGLSGTWPAVVERFSRGIEIFGMPRMVAIALLGLSGLVASTWKRLVQSLYIGLTGREWVIKSSVLLSLSFLVVIWPIGRWLHDDSAVQTAVWDAMPWILAALVCVKLSAAAWIATRLYDDRLVSDRILVTGAACWLAAVLALYGLLVWFVATPFVARYFLLLVSILGIPLARLSAAPLALAWNRHR